MVEYASTSHSGKLVAVAEERNASAGLVSNRQQRSGRVLIEHGWWKGAEA